MDHSRRLKIFLSLASIGAALPLPLLCLSRLWLPKLGLRGGEIVGRLTENPSDFATTAASFHFSMLGFLAAFLAISVAIAQTKPFQAYRKDGHLTVQLWLVSLTMAELALGFVVAMLLLTAAAGPTLVVLNIYAIGVCLLMIVLSLSPIVFMLLQVAGSSDD